MAARKRRPGRPPKDEGEQAKRVTFRLTESYLTRLEEAKWQLRLSKTDVIKLALDELFDKHKIK